MSDQNLTPQSATPLRAVIGAITSGGVGYALYSLMIAIATNFANKPIHSENVLVIRITSAVRTLVLGVTALGTGIFGVVAIGLLALGVQLWLQKLTKQKEG
ncbi:MAG: DUF3082 domain-containing protein [Gloeotrichia echinulata IR180]|jgi:hypothetical protein|nr:DUF3082 domain-containing protein [Gloeotrichia echinulata DEX184]